MLLGILWMDMLGDGDACDLWTPSGLHMSFQERSDRTLVDQRMWNSTAGLLEMVLLQEAVHPYLDNVQFEIDMFRSELICFFPLLREQFLRLRMTYQTRQEAIEGANKVPVPMRFKECRKLV